MSKELPDTETWLRKIAEEYGEEPYEVENDIQVPVWLSDLKSRENEVRAEVILKLDKWKEASKDRRGPIEGF